MLLASLLAPRSSLSQVKADAKKEFRAAKRERRRKIEGKDNLFPNNSSDEESVGSYTRSPTKMQEQVREENSSFTACFSLGAVLTSPPLSVAVP